MSIFLPKFRAFLYFKFVEKTAETQSSNRLARSFVGTAPNSWSGRHKFELPVGIDSTLYKFAIKLLLQQAVEGIN